MSKLVNPREMLAREFVQNVYSMDRKTILFWDTCSLLDVLRLPYRNGDVSTFRTLNRLNGMVQAGEIYSLASSLSIKEWNDHEEKARLDTQSSLEKTTQYHVNCIDIINEIVGSHLISEPIGDKDLIRNLELMAENILSQTIFIQTDEVANVALDRIAHRLPPASKKNEFKDCVIWETILKISRDIYNLDVNDIQVFYTVNTDDFVDKSRQPNIFNPQLSSEASLSGLICCFSMAQVDVRII